MVAWTSSDSAIAKSLQMHADRHALTGVVGEPGATSTINPSPEQSRFLGQQSQTGTAQPAQSPNPGDLRTMLRRTAAAIDGRTTLGENLAISGARVDGKLLILTSQKRAGARGVSNAERRGMLRTMCSLPGFKSLMVNGAAVRLEYRGKGALKGRIVEATPATCSA